MRGSNRKFINAAHTYYPQCHNQTETLPTPKAQDRSMSEKISFQDADGKRISGSFDVTGGLITVSARDGRTKTAEIEDSMLGPETLAKVLLLQLQQEERQDGVSQ